jgi:hypothetical protein
MPLLPYIGHAIKDRMTMSTHISSYTIKEKTYILIVYHMYVRCMMLIVIVEVCREDLYSVWFLYCIPEQLSIPI